MSELLDTPWGKDMLNMRQAAAFLGMEDMTLRQDWKERGLDPIRMGGKLYFPRQQLIDYIELSANPPFRPKLLQPYLLARLEQQAKAAEEARLHYHQQVRGVSQ